MMMMMMMLFFWVLAPCELLGTCQHFGGNTVSVFRVEEDGNGRQLKAAGKQLC
jgi:hypothetical protein